MKKTRNKKVILKRIKAALAMVTIADIIALMNLISLLFRSGIASKILDYIFIIY